MKRLLVVPATLCFFLVLAAQNTEASVLIVYYGKAQCENNPAMIMPNTSLHLMINSTTVPGVGTVTDSEGRFLMTFEVTSKEQLASLMTAEVVITAPPDACGSPSASTRFLAGRPSQLGISGVISDSSDGEKLSAGFHESLTERQDLGNNDEYNGDSSTVIAGISDNRILGNNDGYIRDDASTSSTLIGGISDSLNRLLNGPRPNITFVESGGFDLHL